MEGWWPLRNPERTTTKTSQAPTLTDVARVAGVSLATASRVLNHHPGVRPETRERVLAAMRQLNYRPNLLAAALATKQSRTIGLLVPDISNPFFAEICRGVEDACQVHGFSVIIADTDEDIGRQRRYIELMRQRGIDGIVFTSAVVDDPSIAELVSAGYPCVFISREVDGVEADAVAVDDFYGGYLATKHLVELGHRRIAHLAGPLRTRPGLHRRKGYEAALEEAGIPVDPDLIESCEFTVESGRAAAATLLSRVHPRPTAMFAGNDLIALGAMQEIRRRGLRVPTDISIIGYDRTVLADVADPPLTTMAQPMREMGHRAATMLIKRLAGKLNKPERVVLPVQFHQGGTTAPPPGGK